MHNWSLRRGSMGNYRDRLKIIADILLIASERAKKTRIMYRANLSYRLLCRYLDAVMDAGLISFEDDDCYALTGKGEKFLFRYEQYSKRCRSLKEQSIHVNDEKTALEEMCFNKGKAGKSPSHVARNRKLE